MSATTPPNPGPPAGTDATDSQATAHQATTAGLARQMRMMTHALIHSSARKVLALLSGFIVLIVVATAYGQIRLNQWNRPFYDALSHREFGEFLVQLGVFAVIAGSLLILNVAQQWLSQMLTLKLREGLMNDLLQVWLAPRRAFRLAHAGPIGVNPDQRMHEDARHLTELSATLSIGLLQATVLLAAFVRVLWGISRGFSMRLGHTTLSIPGYMVWAAVVYAGSASLLSYRVGRGLIARNAERYAREADLRFSLVRVNEHIDSITLAEGEAQEAKRIHVNVVAVLAAMRRLVTGLTYLTWVTAGYGWFTIVAPIIAASPLYFAGNLSFGGLMMAAGAFSQVQSSLRWFVDNFSSIADWRATLLRVAVFRRAALDTEELNPSESRIEIVEGAPGKFTLERLHIARPDGGIQISEGTVELEAGARVLVVGKPGGGKTVLFRALAGLWPWGSGRIVRPRGESILYLPNRAYLPPGTLREVLAYPAAGERFDEASCQRALERAGLAHLSGSLRTARDWNTVLGDDEQRALALARAVLHQPKWIIIDETLHSVERAMLPRIADIFSRELQHTGVLHIARSQAEDPLNSRVVHLVPDPAMRPLARPRMPGATSAAPLRRTA